MLSSRSLPVAVLLSLLVSVLVASGANAAPAVTWTPERLEVQAPIGTGTPVSVTVEVARPIEVDDLRATPRIAPLLVGLPTPPADADTTVGPTTRTFTFGVHVPADARPGAVFAGTIHLLDGKKTVSSPLPVTITAVEMPVDPATVLTPSFDRVVDTGTGIPVVVDEVLVTIAEDVERPQERAASIADQLGGRLVGGAPILRTYQILVGTQDLDELARVVELADRLDGVAAATRHLLGTTTETPNDPVWDTWVEGEPAGNNWHMELVDAPRAWDVETGSDDVTVAIVDADFDPHPDLTIDGGESTEGNFHPHGTHVAGIACADGDNAVGISGVSWRCDLRQYEIGVAGGEGAVDLLLGHQYIAQASAAGARVINASYGHAARGGDCSLLTSPEGAAAMADSAVQWRLSLSRADVLGDALVVQSAGNQSCDTGDITQLGLTSDFPSYLVVAAVDDEPVLSNFSNVGEEVSVAAPGGREGGLFNRGALGVLSTVPEDCGWFSCTLYDSFSGTSMAAPMVSGAAALTLAAHPDASANDLATCVVEGARAGGQPVPGHDLHVVHLPSIVECDAVYGDDVDLPGEVDVVFTMDLTGSMSGELARAKQEISEVMAELRAVAPDTDFRFGAASMEDYRGFHDSRPCPDSTYAATYGASTDEPFRVDQALTGDDDEVTAAVAAMRLGNGADGPESFGRALWELGSGAVAWRPDALRLAIVIGDNVPHDTDLHEGFTAAQPAPPGLPRDTGIDPGPDATVDCGGGDDIDFHDDALTALADAEVRLLYVDSSGNEALRTAWRLWSSRTGGSTAEMAPDGTVPDGTLSDLVLELIRAADL